MTTPAAAQQPQDAPDPAGGTGTPAAGAEALTGLSDDDLLEVGRALATPGALAWAAEQPDDDDAGDQESLNTDNEGAPGSREARYRIAAREATERATALQTQVETLQRAEVERIAAAALAHPEDLWAIGAADLSALVTDDGRVDAAAVTEAVQELLLQRPRLAAGAPPPPDFGMGALGSPNAAKVTGWADVLNPQRAG